MAKAASPHAGVLALLALLASVHLRPVARAAAAPWSSVVQSSSASQLVHVGGIPWSASAHAVGQGQGQGQDAPLTVEHDPTTRRQVVHGFGGAFTEAAGFSWKSLTPVDRQRVLELYVGPSDTPPPPITTQRSFPPPPPPPLRLIMQSRGHPPCPSPRRHHGC